MDNYEQWYEEAIIASNELGYACMSAADVIRVMGDELKAARQQAVPSGWVPLLIEYDPGYPEEVAFGPQRMMDRLKLWLDKYFAMIAAAPQADSSPLLAKLDISGIGRDAGHPRAVLLYLRHEPSDDDLRTIQEMFRTAYPAPAPAPAERVEREPAAWVHEKVFALGRDRFEGRTTKPDGMYSIGMVPLYVTPHPAPAAPDVAGLVEALTEILDCPYVLEEATIPRGGVEAAPQQVVGTLHVNLVRMRKARTALSTFHRED